MKYNFTTRLVRCDSSGSPREPAKAELRAGRADVREVWDAHDIVTAAMAPGYPWAARYYLSTTPGGSMRHRLKHRQQYQRAPSTGQIGAALRPIEC